MAACLVSAGVVGEVGFSCAEGEMGRGVVLVGGMVGEGTGMGEGCRCDGDVCECGGEGRRNDGEVTGGCWRRAQRTGTS